MKVSMKYGGCETLVQQTLYLRMYHPRQAALAAYTIRPPPGRTPGRDGCGPCRQRFCRDLGLGWVPSTPLPRSAPVMGSASGCDVGGAAMACKASSSSRERPTLARPSPPSTAHC